MSILVIGANGGVGHYLIEQLKAEGEDFTAGVRKEAQVEQLKEKNIKTYKSYVGNFITSMEMGGFSVTLMKLDDTLKSCIDHPVDCPNFKEV